MQIVIDPRFCGPAATANGGYTCGLLAGVVGGTVEVTLRRPPPLGRPLHVQRHEGGAAVLRDGDLTIAEAMPAELEPDVPAPVSVEEPERASERYTGFERHPFPTCFVCGPQRAVGDGLRIFAGPVGGRGLVASPWTPDRGLADVVRREFVWAALDCPGAFAFGFAEWGEIVLGRLTAELSAPVPAGERHVVVGWPIGEDGRKLHAGTALFSVAGELRATARATWIAPSRHSH